MNDTVDINANAHPRVKAHLPKVKAKARRLSDWTGLPLSKSQELTAIALGATSWQAFLKNPWFVPDEHYNSSDSFTRMVWAGKSPMNNVMKRLSDELGICSSQAMFIASMWQPSAIRPVYEPYFKKTLPIDDQIEVAFTHDSLKDSPEGFLVASGICIKQNKWDNKLGLVHNERLQRFMHRSDFFDFKKEQLSESLIAANAAFSEYIHHQGSSAKQLKEKFWLAIEAPDAIRFEKPHAINVQRSVRFKNKWLRHGIKISEMLELTKKHFQWTEKGLNNQILSLNETVFWSHQAEGFDLTASLEIGSVVAFKAFTKTGEYLGYATAGPGRIIKNGKSETWHLGDSKSWISKPLPLVNLEVAKLIGEKTGLSITQSSEIDFWRSDAGLAFSKWLVFEPNQHISGSSQHLHLFENHAYDRIEFELIQMGVI